MANSYRSAPTLVTDHRHDYCTPLVFQIFMPDSRLITKWQRLILISVVVNLFTDVFFIYLPSVSGPLCFSYDNRRIILYILVFRTVGDSLFLMYMILNFRTAIECKGPKIFHKTNMITNSWVIAKAYLKSDFIVDVFAVLPFPQIIICSMSLTITYTHIYISWAIYLQLLPRALAMLLLERKISKAASTVLRTAWSGAMYNLFVFIMAGHYIGAGYYTFYMLRFEECLDKLYQNEILSNNHVLLDCNQLHKECVSRFKQLEYGMLSDAFKNHIGSRSFMQKFIYCFVWGVRSLSSLGQIFDTSFDLRETFVSCMIMVTGLVLLADLIARMQTYVQSSGVKIEQQRVKQRRLEEWTHYHDLPHNLKGLVQQSIQTEWQGTKGIDDEGILNSLPLDLQRDIRTNLYKERVHNIPPFSRMDEQLLNFICGHLKTFTRVEGTYIVLQGDPLDQVLFVFTGILQLTTHHSSSRSHSRNLEAGDFFGDDLLITWALQPNSSTQNLPPSTFTVKCLTNVEAFCLPAEHLRLLVIFNYFQRFQRALRKHSP